ARRTTRAVAEPLPRRTTPPGADPGAAQQSMGLRETPWGWAADSARREAIRSGRLPSPRDARSERGGVAPLDRSNPRGRGTGAKRSLARSAARPAVRI